MGKWVRTPVDNFDPPFMAIMVRCGHKPDDSVTIMPTADADEMVDLLFDIADSCACPSGQPCDRCKRIMAAIEDPAGPCHCDHADLACGPERERTCPVHGLEARSRRDRVKP